VVSIVSRVAAAIFGGYAFVWGFTTLLIALALSMRLPYGDAQTTAYLLAFLLFLGAFLWAFTARRVAVVACTVELVGVLVIGTASLIWPDAFPDATVWSAYGRGYGFVPLVLPVLGLLWLRRSAGVGQRRRGLGERV